MSVGLPVDSGARFLSEALDCWLAQDFNDFELIVSDNASTDATPEILKEYALKDLRIRVVRRDETVVAYENFNGLVSEASAPLFVWAACDDLWDPSFLSQLVGALDERSDVVLAYCNPRYFGERSRVRSHHPTATVNPPGSEATPLARAISVLRVSGWLPVHGVIRTDVLRKSWLFFYPMGIAADVGLILELADLGKFHCVPKVLMSTRLRSDSLSRDLRDPIHFGRAGRRFDAGVLKFAEGLPLSPRERRLFIRELQVYCRKAQKPRRHLWRISGFRSLYVRISRALIDLERVLRGL